MNTLKICFWYLFWSDAKGREFFWEQKLWKKNAPTIVKWGKRRAGETVGKDLLHRS